MSLRARETGLRGCEGRLRGREMPLRGWKVSLRHVKTPLRSREMGLRGGETLLRGSERRLILEAAGLLQAEAAAPGSAAGLRGIACLTGRGPGRIWARVFQKTRREAAVQGAVWVRRRMEAALIRDFFPNFRRVCQNGGTMASFSYLATSRGTGVPGPALWRLHGCVVALGSLPHGGFHAPGRRSRCSLALG